MLLRGWHLGAPTDNRAEFATICQPALFLFLFAWPAASSGFPRCCHLAAVIRSESSRCCAATLVPEGSGRRPLGLFDEIIRVGERGSKIFSAASWLYDLLSQHVTKLVVCNPRPATVGKYRRRHLVKAGGRSP